MLTRLRLCGVAAVLLLAVLAAQPCLALTARDMLERTQLTSMSLAPDGTRIIYETLRSDLDKNENITSVWLQSIGSPVKSRLPIDAHGLYAWRSDGSEFLFVDDGGNVCSWRVANGTQRIVISKKRLLALFPAAASVTVREMHVSRPGTRVALVVTVTDKIDERPLRGVEVGGDWAIAPPGPPSVVFPPSTTTVVIFNTGDESLTHPVPARFEVSTGWGQSIDWSPNGEDLVFAASTDSRDTSAWQQTNFMDADLYLLDVKSDQIRTLVSQPGFDNTPFWSPDGKRIAFRTLGGHIDWRYNSQIGILDVSTSKARYEMPTAAKSYDPEARYVRPVGWSRDSRNFYFAVPVRGHVYLSNLDIRTKVVRRLSQESDLDVAGRAASAPLAASDLVVANMSGFNHLPDLFLWRGGDRHLTPVTDLNPNINAHPIANVREISWRSSDNKYDLQGFLLTPPTPSSAKPPLIVHVGGGPNMVGAASLGEPGLTDFTDLMWPVLLSDGYAIFLPNNRGREGFGDAFLHAFSDDRSENRVPAKDVIEGTEAVLKLDLVDAQCVGITAHSFGGGQAAFALELSRLFKAASIHEAAFLSPYDHYSSGSHADNWAHIYGGTDAFDPMIEEPLRRDTPTSNAEAIRTPTLIEAGVESLAEDQAKPFYQVLRRYGVLSEFVVYPRSGHNTDEPVLIIDSYERNREWFDYWLRRKATDRMRLRYGDPAR